MAWETRKRGRRYYYRVFRDSDGNVQREYVGTGPEAELLAEQDRLKRKQRRELRQRVNDLEAELAKAQQVVRSLDEHHELVLAASLIVAGFHHWKGTWRFKRDQKS